MQLHYLAIDVFAELPWLQVELVKPLGLRFARGSDGGAYVKRSDPNLGSTDSNIQV